MKKIIKVLLCLSVFIPLYGCSSKNILLKEDIFTLEYGQPINTEAKEYLNTEKMEEKIVSATTMDTSAIKNEEEKEYPMIGEYKIFFQYEEEKVEAILKVQDTTKPVFKDFKEILEVVKDCVPEKGALEKNFTAEDLSEVKISLNVENVDYAKAGDYKVTVLAKDSAGNEEAKETILKVVEPILNLEKDSLSLYVKETSVLEVEVKGKETKASFKSSDASVASVDANGKVTAKKKGSATITASANGKEDSCKVTVKSAPSGSSTTTKKNSSGSSSSSSSSSSGAESGSAPSRAVLSRSAFDKINTERTKAGLTPFVWDSSLESLALTRAKEISTKFSHVRPDGSNVNTSEVLASGAGSATIAVNSWMNSTNHRNALMREDKVRLVVAQYGDCWVSLISY